MKTTVLALFLLTMLSGCSKGATTHSGKKSPKLRVIGHSAVNLGLLLPDAASSQHTFQLQNESRETVGISVTDVSCSCAKAHLDRDSLLPGESAYLTVGVRSNQPGVKKANVVVSSQSHEGSDLVRVAVEALIAGLTLDPETVRLTASSYESTALRGQAVLKIYTTSADDLKLLEFDDSPATGEADSILCAFEQGDAQTVQGGVQMTVPVRFEWDMSGQKPARVHYRECVIRLAKGDRTLELKFLAWIEPPQDYRIQPAAIVIRLHGNGGGTATGSASLRVVAGEGIPQVDSLSVKCALSSLSAEVSGAGVEVRYDGPDREQPLSTDILLFSPRFSDGRQKVPVLVLPQ